MDFPDNKRQVPLNLELRDNAKSLMGKAGASKRQHITLCLSGRGSVRYVREELYEYALWEDNIPRG